MRDNTQKTFIFVGLIFLILLLLHLLPSLSVFDTPLRRVSILSEISDSPLDKEQKDVIPKPVEPKREALVSTDKNGKKISFKENWPKGVQRIVDFSNGKAGGMAHFYALLDSLSRHKSIGRPVRVAYYGDSFIEGDILVSDLRELMQARYGGYGVGWIDAGNELNKYKRTIMHSFSGLTEHMVMKRDSYTFANGGIAERYYPMASGASVSLHSKAEYPHVAKWNVARLYCKAPAGLSINMSVDGGTSSFRSLGAASGLQVVETKQSMNNIHYSLSGSGATLFGVALESDNGIVIDNFSMRGSSGTTLSKIPEATLCDFNSKRPYDLIILQFGMNAITAKSTGKQVEAYMQSMKSVVAHFKKCFPEASLLIVSTPDRGTHTSNGIGTMHGVEMLAGYQEKLASETGVAFYNLFLAMGGEGSMGRLTGQGCGSKDFVHINYKGGKIISKHIFDSFVAGQKNWTNRQKAIKESME